MRIVPSPPIFAWLLIVWLSSAAVLPSSRVLAQTVTHDEVTQAIDKLKKRIYAAQNKAGLWNDAWEKDDSIHGVQWGGVTALCTYALMQSGESYQNPKLRKALVFLRQANLPGTYARSVRAQLWGALPDTFSQYLAQDTRWLALAAHEGPKGGLIFTYWQDQRRKGNYSNSRTKFGTLGLWEGAKRGHAVSPSIWRGIEEHYLNTQNQNGGWGYSTGQWDHSRGSMTAAGLIALHVILDYHHRGAFRSTGKRLAIQDSIDRGLQWFDKHYVANKVPETGGKKGGYSNVFYYLYAIERMGLASGVKYFNGKPWFESGARVIIDQVEKGGLNPGKKINSKFKQATSVNKVISMAFALIFLARGGNPIMINKLEVPDYAWNNRPSDLAKLTEWMSNSIETSVLWQRAPIDTSPKTWQDAPLMYLASHQALALNDKQLAKIKQYLDAGGMLITTADGSSQSFSRSVKEAMEKLYPRFTFGKLSENDPLLTATRRVDAKRLKLEALHNGVRPLVLHLSQDVSWTLHSEDRGGKNVRDLFANAYFYATGGWPRSRADQPLPSVKSNSPVATIARVTYEGNYDPEPLAWQGQNRFMGRRVRVKTTEMPAASLADADVKLAHLSGTEAVKLSEEDLAGIKAFVKRGGWLLVENVGGNGAFASAITKQLKVLYPGKTEIPLDPTDPVLTGQVSGTGSAKGRAKGLGEKGYDVTRVRYRKFTILRSRGSITRRPRMVELFLKGEKAIKGRILITQEDLSSGMLGNPAWGINGYAIEPARQMVTNIVLLATKPSK